MWPWICETASPFPHVGVRPSPGPGGAWTPQHHLCLFLVGPEGTL